MWACGGCAIRQSSVAFDRKAPEPGIDAAIVERHFDNSVALYENTTIVAGGTRFPLLTAPQVRDPARPVVEPAVFIANVAQFPLALIFEPPFAYQQAWRVCGTGPTFSGNPSLDDAEPAGPRPVASPNEPRVGP